jgi:hypothetical protein
VVDAAEAEGASSAAGAARVSRRAGADGRLASRLVRRASPAAVLMVMIDDATGCVDARFFEAETQGAAFEMALGYARKHGLPGALYVDRAGIYRCDREATDAEILAGKEPQTEFGRALETLGMALILARRPKGAWSG